MNFFTKTQKTIIIVTAAVSGLFILAVIFFYLPIKDQLRTVKQSLLQIENEISQIEKLTDKDSRLDIGIEGLQQKLFLLRDKFPEKENQTIKNISDLARRMDISVNSIAPRAKTVYLNEKLVNMDNKKVYNILVTLSMRCSYQSLVNYLEHLRKNMATAVSVESLMIKDDLNDTKKLSVNLDLNVYLLL